MSSGEQRDVRCAAETLYQNIQQPGPSRYGMYACTNIFAQLLKWANQFWNICFSFHFGLAGRSNQNAHLDLLSFVHEDYIAGYTQDGQMSTVRRFFCLFVMFDLFFISMLWFICIMVSEKLNKKC